MPVFVSNSFNNEFSSMKNVATRILAWLVVFYQHSRPNIPWIIDLVSEHMNSKTQSIQSIVNFPVPFFGMIQQQNGFDQQEF